MQRKAAAFLRENLPLAEVPGTGLRLHLAGPRSGLSRLVPRGKTPYWAYVWPGGLALAWHILAHPNLVAGERKAMTLWDIGAGSGIVSIAAKRAGSHAVLAIDRDPLALLAARVNAEANGVSLNTHLGGFAEQSLDAPPSEPYLIMAGDVFYEADIAVAATAWLDRQPDHATILVGDICRHFLPRDRLEPLACYPVRDVGDPPSAPLREGWVFRWKPR